MKLQHIRDVLAVAKFGSLRAAARHLGMEQPSISRSIQDIERELGAALFTRLPRGVCLTPIGEAFVKRAAIIDIELQRVRDDVDYLKSVTTGNITVAFSLAASMELLSSTLTPFNKRFPAAHVTILETLLPPIEERVIAGEIDAYIGILERPPLVSPNLVIEELFDIEMMVVAGRDQPMVAARSIQELDSMEWSWLLTRPRNGKEKSATWASPLGLDHPKKMLLMNSVLQIVLALNSSKFLAIVPRQWLEMPALGNLISPVAVAPSCESMPLCLVRQRDVPMTPMAEYFCQIVRGQAKDRQRRGKPLAIPAGIGGNVAGFAPRIGLSSEARGQGASTTGLKPGFTRKA